MSAIAAPYGLSAGVSPQAANARLIGLISTGAVALGVFLSGFVVREPAPYELYMVALIGVWALFGLRISQGVYPLLALLVIFNIGGMISITQMAAIKDTPMYIAVSLFLAFTAVFYAAVVSARPSLYPVMFKAWVAAAVSTAIVGVLGYFHAFPGAEIFTKYDRAAGAFQDPNVFGPFLTLPGLYLLHQMLTTRLSRMPLYAVPLLIIVFGIFLSFSRGAWALFAGTAVFLTLMLMVQNRSGAFRIRIIVMSMIAVALMAAALLIALQIPSIADIFTTRAKLVQDYDGARLGRFARHAIGFLMAMEHPLGIGPLEFGLKLGEDTHNVWLKALLDYGWLGFAAWLTMIVWTLSAGFKLIFRPSPWQPYILCAWVALTGHVALGWIIDTDHWRHFYLLLGLVWGAIALDRRARIEAFASRMTARAAAA
ncbi:MAG: O-antigen ligase family protein [Rhizobiaceae bacterium]